MSLGVWEAARQADLATNDLIEECICCSNGASHSADTTTCTVVGWTTGTNNYIDIKTELSSRPACRWDTSKYRRTYPLGIQENYVRITGIAIKTSNNALGTFSFIPDPAEVADIRISYCYAEYTGTSGMRPFDFYSCAAGSVARVWNCVGVSRSTSGSSYVFYANDDDWTLYWYNCTGVLTSNTTAGICFRKNKGVVYLKNCLGYRQGGVGACFAGTFNSASYCAADDDTADNVVGDGHRINQTFTFVDAANGDYSLTASDAGARDYGVDLSSDLSLAFSDDAKGSTRSGTWDIGAFEYIVPLAFPPLFARKQNTLLRR